MMPLQMSAQCTADPASPTIISKPGGGVTTLSSDFYPLGDIWVSPANTLRVLADVFMCQDAHIYVQRGARLEVIGGSIQGIDGFAWRGIELWGRSDTPHPSMSTQDIINGSYPSGNPIQANNEHGVVVFTKNAVLRDAFNGISTKSSFQGGHTGGIIIAKDATFLNNRRTVEFLSFQFENISAFEECQFQFTSGGLSTVGNFKIFVTMWDVHGVLFINENQFSYAGGASGFDYYAAQYQGPTSIYSINSDYTVTDNTFIAMRRSIHAQNTMVTSGDIQIDGNDFYEEFHEGGCILLQGVENSSILNNKFLLDDLTINGIYNYGLFLDQCDGYRVEGNNASNVGDFDPLANVGILVNFTGFGANEIYRNGHGFFDVTKGIVTQQQNSQLQIRCNDLEQVVDYNIAGLGAPLNMSQFQGDCNSGVPAGNTFNANATPDKNIFIEQAISSAVLYRHHSNDPYTPHHRTGPQSVVINEDCFIMSNNTTCPDRTIENPCPTFPFCRVQEISSYNQGIAQLEIDKTQETPNSPEYISLGNQIAYVSLQRDLVYNQMIREGMQLGQLMAVITELEQLSNHRIVEQKLIPLYLAAKDYTKTSQALTSFVPQNSSEILFKDYYSTLYDIHSVGRDYTQMTIQEENMIRSIASSTTTPLARKAQNILTFAFDEYYPETYLPFPSNRNKQAMAEAATSLITVFPNPSDAQLSIRLSSSIEWQKPQIVLFDIHGRKLDTYAIANIVEDFLIDTSELPRGIYWINVLDEDVIKVQQKIIIAH